MASGPLYVNLNKLGVRPFSRLSRRGLPNRRHRSTPLHAAEFRVKCLRSVVCAVIDARDFNGVLLDLVGGNVGRKDQFAPPAHASGAATVGKVSQRSAAVIDGFQCLPSGGGFVFRDLRETMQVGPSS